MAATPDPDDLRRLRHMRMEELEGFIDGLFGDEEVIDLPERATAALDNLGEITSRRRSFTRWHYAWVILRKWDKSHYVPDQNF